MITDWDKIEQEIRDQSYPHKLRLSEKVGSVYRGETHYFDFDVDGILYELVEERAYRTNSWARFERAEVRIWI